MTTLAFTLEMTPRVDGARVSLSKITRNDGVVIGYAVFRNDANGDEETLFRGISEASARMWFNHFAK
jgi:hypothetical protein